MHDRGKSDSSVVPGKPPNRAEEPAAEAVEGRGLAKGKTLQQNVPRTQGRHGAPSALERIRQAAQRTRRQRFTALLHHVYDLGQLRQAYLALTRDAAAGVDGETWRHYGEDLEANLQDLSGRLQRGAYRARPVRRTFIPKADGRQRPLGVPALEDKLVQRAVSAVLNALYEADFLGFSYGFRPGRSPHHALDALATGIHRRRVNWVGAADKAACPMGCKSPVVNCPCGRPASPMHAKVTTRVLLGRKMPRPPCGVTATVGATWVASRRGGLNVKE